MPVSSLALVFLAAQASAAPAAQPTDARCLALFSLASGKATTDESRRFVALGITYYLGKVDAKGQGKDLSGLIARELRAMNPQIATAAGAKCQVAVQNRLKALAAAGQQLKAMGQKKAAPAK